VSADEERPEGKDAPLTPPQCRGGAQYQLCEFFVHSEEERGNSKRGKEKKGLRYCWLDPGSIILKIFNLMRITHSPPIIEIFAQWWRRKRSLMKRGQCSVRILDPLANLKDCLKFRN